MDTATCAYIAGFLDGDGSIIFQIVPRKDYKLRFQIRASICFYQSVKNSHGIVWLKRRLKVGYVRVRGSIVDYTIVGLDNVRAILEAIQPHVVFKRLQVERGLELLTTLESQMSPEALIHAATLVDKFATLNYSKTKHIDAQTVKRFLRV